MTSATQNAPAAGGGDPPLTDRHSLHWSWPPEPWDHALWLPNLRTHTAEIKAAPAVSVVKILLPSVDF